MPGRKSQTHRSTKESLNEFKTLLELQCLLLKQNSLLYLFNFLSLRLLVLFLLLSSSLGLWGFDKKSLPNCHIEKINEFF